MAHIVPSDITRAAFAGSHSAELDTLKLLQRDLPNDYTVFHSVHWTNEYQKHTRFGEADFVVINQAGDGIVIEQKNGPLKETGEGLVKDYGSSTSNPVNQARRSIDQIKQKFSGQHRGEQKPQLDYLIYCPDYQVRNVNAAGIDASRIVDARKKDTLAKHLSELLGPGVYDSGKHKLITGFLRQSFDLIPDIHAHARKGEQAFVRLSGGLAETLSRLEMSPLRLRVMGSPGCGKTVVALRLFERAVAAGRRPLLVCFNRALREKLALACPEGGAVQTWYGLLDKFLAAQGFPLDFDSMHNNPDFWPEAERLALDCSSDEAWQFDTVIVDEGQDFRQEWLDILEIQFIREGADIVWLEDQHQNIWGRPPVTLDDFVGYRAQENYRSPQSIARFMQRALPFEFEALNDLPGLGVKVRPWQDSEGKLALLAATIKELLASGFSEQEILILSLRGSKNSSLGKLEKVGKYTLRKFRNEYDLFGNQIYTAGQIRSDSLHRYKGQQDRAVIVIDVEKEDRDLELTDRMLYTAFSRATARLELLVEAGGALGKRLARAAG